MPEYKVDASGNAVIVDDKKKEPQQQNSGCGCGWYILILIIVAIIASNINSSKTASVGLGSTTIEIKSGEITRVEFEAPSSGVYIFKTIGIYDTYGYLYSSATSSTAIIENDDYIGQTDNGANFQMEYRMTAGQKVYVGVRFYERSAGGTVTLNISKK